MAIYNSSLRPKVRNTFSFLKEDKTAENQIPAGIEIIYSRVTIVDDVVTTITASASNLIQQAIGRIGKESTRIQYTQNESDTATSGSVGRITFFGNRDIDDFDARRQGRNIENISQFDKSISPMVQPGTSFFTEAGTINHFYVYNEIGQDVSFEYNVKDYELISYIDHGKLKPQSIVGNSYGYGGLIIDDASTNSVFYKDSMKYKMNSVIDVFDLRNSISTSQRIKDINKLTSLGAKCSVFVHSSHSNFRGESIVTDEISYASLGSSDSFLFSDTGKKEPASGLNHNIANIFPFKDIKHLFEKDSRYSILNSTSIKSNFLSGSEKTKSNVGENFKTTTRGLIYDSRTGLGTDSIAFGGFLK